MALRLTEAEYAALIAKRRSNVGQLTDTKPARRGKNHEDALAALLDARCIPYVREYRFHPTRKFRFDFALLPLCMRLALELDGGVHVIRRQWSSDREKSNLALAAGWRVLHIGVDQMRSDATAELIRGALLQNGMRSLQPLG